MIKITITSVKVDSTIAEVHPTLHIGTTVYYIIRDSGARLSDYFREEELAVCYAWQLVKKYGLTLVEPW